MSHSCKKTVIFLIAFLLLLVSASLIIIASLLVDRAKTSGTGMESVYGVYKFDKTLSQNAYWNSITESPTFIFLKGYYILDFGADNYGVYSGIKYMEETVSDNEFDGIDISYYKNRKKYVITAKGNFTGSTIYVMDKEVWLSYYACANTPYIFRLRKIDIIND